MEYEKIIGQALLTGDHDKALRRVTCKTAADYAAAKQEPPIVRVATWARFIIIKGV